MRRSIAPLVSSLLLIVPLATRIAGAQVGYPPSRSPYLDLERTQELTLVVGNYHGHKDAARVAPQGGTLIGAHYEWRAGGPAHLVAEIARISSDSRVRDPFKAGDAREVGTTSRPLYSADAGLGLSLTGGKSWRRIVPEIGAGFGFVSDFRSKPDTGGFRFGTRFSINGSVGLRIVPGERWQIRADLKDRMYTIGYPDAFYLTPAGGTAILAPNHPKSFWTHNPALTFGLSRLF